MKKLIDKLFRWMGYGPLYRRIPLQVKQEEFQIHEIVVEKIMTRIEVVASHEFRVGNLQKQLLHELMESLHPPLIEWQVSELLDRSGWRHKLILRIAVRKDAVRLSQPEGIKL